MTTYRQCETCRKFGVVDGVCEKCGCEGDDFRFGAIHYTIPFTIDGMTLTLPPSPCIDKEGHDFTTCPRCSQPIYTLNGEG